MNIFKKILFSSALFAGMIAGSTNAEINYDQTSKKLTIIWSKFDTFQQIKDTLEKCTDAKAVSLEIFNPEIQKKEVRKIIDCLNRLLQLRNLEIYDFSETRTLIDNAMLQSLSPYLDSLTLTGAGLSQITDAFFQRLPPSLTRLSLCGLNQITGTGFTYLPRLRELQLVACNNITDINLTHLPKDLNYLELSLFPHVVIKKLIANLPHNLTTLKLSFDDITDHYLACIPRNLEALILNSNNIRGDGFGDLPQTLKTLSLVDCDQLQDASLSHLPTTLTGLKLSNCSQITDNGLSKIPCECKLDAICLNNIGITDTGLASLPKRLKHLVLKSCREITDAGITHLPQKLETLNLTFNTKLTSNAITQLPPKLKSLTLRLDPAITEEQLAQLPQSLTTLSLYICWYREEIAGLTQLPQGIKKLVTILAGPRSYYTEHAIEEFRRQRPNVIIETR